MVLEYAVSMFVCRKIGVFSFSVRVDMLIIRYAYMIKVKTSVHTVDASVAVVVSGCQSAKATGMTVKIATVK